MMPEQMSFDRLLHRARAEYQEMPGLRLTLSQATRLWGLDRVTCVGLLDVLMNAGFLARTADGCYVRSDAGPRRRQPAGDMRDGREVELISQRRVLTNASRRRP